MAVEGSLDLFRLPEILQVISQEGKTGILTVRGEKDIVAISFAKGRVVAADALNRTLEGGLGETLAKDGLLDRARYAAAVAEQKRSGGRLIDVLVDRGYLERVDLLSGLRRHTSDLLAELLAWDDGEFKFYANDEVSFEEGFDPIVVETFLLHHLDAVSSTGSAPVAMPTGFEPVGAGGLGDLETTSADGGDDDLWETDLGDFTPLTPPAASPPLDALPGSATPAPAPEDDPDDVFPSLGTDPFEAVAVPAATPTPTPAPAPTPPPVATPTPARASRPAPAPAAAPAEWEDEEPAPAPRPARDVAPVAARWLAALAALGLLAVFWWAPLEALLAMPWDAPVRQQAGRYYEATRLPVLDALLRGHYLTEDELPESLEPLADAGQVSPATLVSPLAEGRRQLAFRSDGLEYSIAFREDPAAVYQGSLAGDFLLDPDTLGTIRREGPPLVLLD